MPCERLDIYVKNKLNISRAKAQELISGGNVLVNGRVNLKSSAPVDENTEIDIINKDSALKYVGRGGFKLEAAIENFNIDIHGICTDIGSSTGGFTDCLLQHGAEKVYAVDVGTAQLDEKLRNDKRVISLENTDIRYADIEKCDFICCDVSFISLEKIFPSAAALLKENALAVFLVKPQFEAGRENISKNGVVRDKNIHIKVLENVLRSAVKNGLEPLGLMPSPIRGGDGNAEYLLCAKHCANKQNFTETITHHDIKNIADAAFRKK